MITETTAQRITLKDGRQAFSFNGETQAQAQARYDRIDSARNDLFFTGETPAPYETVDGHEVETVGVEDLKADDQVVFTSGKSEFFAPVSTGAFRSYTESRRTGERVYGDYTVSIGGTRRYVAPGTTFRRAKNPDAVNASRFRLF